MPSNAVAVHTQIAITLRERDHPIEFAALHPLLKFAWFVAGVRAAFEHRDDDHFDFDWLLLSGCASDSKATEDAER